MKNTLLILILFCNSAITFAQGGPVKKISVYLPAFKTYKTDSIYTGKAAEVDFKSNPELKMFRTVIRKGYKNYKLNFAGHYCFVFWGCGSECQASAIVDLITGKVYDGVDATLGYRFNENSRMVIVNPPNTKGEMDDFCMDCTPGIWVFNERTKKFGRVNIKLPPGIRDYAAEAAK